MTGVWLVALYLLALSLFLGLDIISKVPQTLYPLVIATLGALAAVGVAGGLYLVGPGVVDNAGLLGRVALGCGALAGAAGVAAIGRLLSVFRKKKAS